MANRSALFLEDRPIGYVDGRPVFADKAFSRALQNVASLLGGSDGILPGAIGGGVVYGPVYIDSAGNLASTAALTNGQVLVGSSGNPPVPASLTGTTNRITVTNGAGSITLTTPQDTHSGASPTFAGLTISGQTANLVYAGPSSGAAGNATFRSLVAADLAGLSGTYTPTLTNTTNVAASTPYAWNYIQLGAFVIASGRVDVDPTGAGQVVLGISLPVVSDLANDYDLTGTASAIAVAGQSAGLHADTTNNRALLEWVAVDTANRAMYCTMIYRVII